MYDDEKQDFDVRVCQFLLIIVFIMSDKNAKQTYLSMLWLKTDCKKKT